MAVVGASRDPTKPGGFILRYLLESTARVYPVHPTVSEIHGVPCYPSLDAVPEPVDLAVVATPVSAVPRVIQDCVRRGVRVAILVAGGFGETGEEGRQREEELVRIARTGGMRILGPNTLGVLVPRSGLDTLFIVREKAPRPGPGPIAFISQSGAIAVTRMSAAAWEGIGFHSFVGLGNRADIQENELLAYLATQPGVGSVAMYLESFADGAGFFDLAREVSTRLPLSLVKAGRSPGGAKAASLHTGSLSGSERVVGGVLRQAGVYRAYDDEELIDVAWAMACLPLPQGDRVAVVVSAGGHGVMLADFLEAAEHSVGLRLASFSERTQEKLRREVLPFASVANPIDLTASATLPMYERVLSILAEEPSVDAVLCSVQVEPPGLDERLVDVIIAYARATAKPVVAASIGGEASLRVRRALNRAGVPAYPSLWRAARALGAVVERARRLHPE
ncbi:MAG: CoA-binding protein [Armatimonadota bacterium]|nr:CoA-binding protein [Armatimonadota bacterium]MDR5703006.1 CoA-binding protein [Armatimonadota bacterium]